jgi:hypothetical protein
MDNLNELIISASRQSIVEELADNDDLMEPLEAGLREEAAKQMLEIPQVEEVYQEEPEVMDISRSYPKNRHRSAEAEMQDRLLTIPLRPPESQYPKGSLWVATSGFVDQIALLNLTKSEQFGLLRIWSDIQVLACGDGNEDIVEEEQMEFMMKVVSYKSRSDNPERGIRERTAHITNKTISDQTVTMPKNDVQRSGFLNTILGRNKQQPPLQH